MSVLVGGSLQRFQRLGVEEKGHDADEGDAVAVGPGLFVWIAGHNDLPEVVAAHGEKRDILKFGTAFYKKNLVVCGGPVLARRAQIRLILV